MRRLLLVILMLGVAVTGCRNGSQAAGTRPSSNAHIAIVEPRPDAVVTTSTFVIRMSLEGGRIVPQTSRHLTPNEGHVHVSIDGAIQSQTFGLTQTLETPKRGRHLLQVEFVAKDHGPFVPRVLASVPFRVTR